MKLDSEIWAEERARVATHGPERNYWGWLIVSLLALAIVLGIALR